MASDHELFQQHVRDSEPSRWVTAQWLVKKGYSVWLHPVQIAPTADQWKDYVDDGDLRINMVVEVKQRSFDFTSSKDWPYADFIVCGKNSFDRARPKPYAYIIVDRDFSHLAFVRSADSAKWRVERKKDSRYANVEQEYYFAPLDSVTFTKMEQA